MNMFGLASLRRRGMKIALIIPKLQEKDQSPGLST